MRLRRAFAARSRKSVGRLLRRWLNRLSPKLLENFRDLLRCDLAVGLTSDHHHGSEAAGADAAHLAEGELHVRRGLTGVDAQLPFQLIEDARCAFDVARGSGADVDLWRPFGFRLKKW